jgi:hypothetical protein
MKGRHIIKAIGAKSKVLAEVILMTIREIAIAKLQQLPEPLLQEVSDFIDFMIHQHQPKTANLEPEFSLAEA